MTGSDSLTCWVRRTDNNMRGNHIGLCAGLGMIILISEVAVIQGIAADIPAESPIVKFEYIREEDPPKAAGVMYPRTHDIQVYTDEEIDELCRIAQAEAGNQTEDGMFFVMSVVLNRVSSEDFPADIHSVIHQSGAFSAVKNGSFDRAVPSDECIKAYDRIASGDIAPEIIAFEAKSSDVLDQYFRWAFTHKGHKFYTKK